MAQSAASVIRKLLNERGEGKTICPSEAARALAGSDERAAWEPKMDTVRKAAARMADAGEIVVTQKGHIVDITTVRGPVRLSWK